MLALTLTVVQLAAPPAGVADPYGCKTFREFHGKIDAGHRGVLYVRVPDRSVGTQQVHCRVDAGFEAFEAGVWDCWKDGGTGQLVMDRRKATAAPAPPMDAESWRWFLTPPGRLYCPPGAST